MKQVYKRFLTYLSLLTTCQYFVYASKFNELEESPISKTYYAFNGYDLNGNPTYLPFPYNPKTNHVSVATEDMPKTIININYTKFNNSKTKNTASSQNDQ